MLALVMLGLIVALFGLCAGLVRFAEGVIVPLDQRTRGGPSGG